MCQCCFYICLVWCLHLESWASHTDVSMYQNLWHSPLSFVAIWMTKVIGVNFLFSSRVREQLCSSGLSPAEDAKVVRKGWKSKLKHPNLSRRWFDLPWAGCWTRDLQSSLPAPVPMWKATYISSWILPACCPEKHTPTQEKLLPFCWKLVLDKERLFSHPNQVRSCQTSAEAP